MVTDATVTTSAVPRVQMAGLTADAPLAKAAKAKAISVQQACHLQ